MEQPYLSEFVPQSTRSGVMILSPGFNPSSPKYKVFNGLLHAKDALWIILAVQFFWIFIDFCAVIGFLHDRIVESPVFGPFVAYLTVLILVSAITIVGIIVKHFGWLIPNLVVQCLGVLVLSALSAALIASFLCACPVLRTVFLSDEKYVSDTALFWLGIGLCVSFILQAVCQVWFAIVSLASIRFLRDTRVFRSRVHTNLSLVMREMPEFRTPATIQQPFLETMEYNRDSAAAGSSPKLRPSPIFHDVYVTPIQPQPSPYRSETSKERTARYVKTHFQGYYYSSPEN